MANDRQQIDRVRIAIAVGVATIIGLSPVGDDQQEVIEVDDTVAGHITNEGCFGQLNSE